MTLYDVLNSGNLLQCVDVLRVIPQKFGLSLKQPDKAMSVRGLEMARKKFLK